MDFRHFLSELRRRKVFRVAGAYAVTAWVLMQAADLFGPALLLPDWVTRAVAFAILLGFPAAIVLAWAFDMTTEGVTRTESATAPAPTRSHSLVRVGAGALALAVFSFAAWHVAGPGRGAAPAPGAEDEALAPGADSGDEPVYLALLENRGSRSVAVLPFDNLGPDTADAYFAAGIHDAVITALANVAELTVTSRTSVMSYAGSGKDVRTIAGELGVTHLVEGTVQRAGGRARVTVQLIDAATDRHLWADHFEREVTPQAVFAIQSGIAEQVAGALEASLSPGERSQIERRPTENVEAWELFTRARHLVRTSTYSPELNARVLAMLRRAAALDPSFALAHAELALRYGDEWSGTDQDRWRDSARVAAERAMRIDPSLPEAHFALADYHGAVRDLEAELRATLRALELRPNYAEAISRLSRIEADLARLDRSLCLARRAVEIEPTVSGGWIRLGAAYRDLGFFARAEDAFRTGLERGASSTRYRSLVEVALAQGARARALEYYRALRIAVDSSARGLQEVAAVEWQLGWADSATARFDRAEALGAPDRFELRRADALLRTGQRGRAEEVLSRFEPAIRDRADAVPSDFFPFLYITALHAMRGEVDAAVDAVEDAVDRRFRILPWIEPRPGSSLSTLPGMERLQQDARYREIMARLAAAQDSMRRIVERNGC